MNIWKRIKNKFTYFCIRRYVSKKRNSLQEKLNQQIEMHRLYFFCTPTHSNLGDQAQLMCWLRLFREWYPEHEVVCVPTRYRQFKTLRTIHEKVKEGDLIFIHSGYLIFDPHPELPFILDIVRAFYDMPIVILPQTVNLMGEWYRHIVSGIFNSHSDLTLVCRDEVSLKKAEVLFPNVKLKLMPDVVASLIGQSEFQYETQRNGIMLCIRNDGEKLYTDDEIEILRKRFGGVKTEFYDTTINASIWQWDKNREMMIKNVLKKFAEFQVVITDRYHGTIFSLIANTPVIVLSSKDHKLSSGVKWFPKERFGRNIIFAKDLDEAYYLALNILELHGENMRNPTWIKDNYYTKVRR